MARSTTAARRRRRSPVPRVLAICGIVLAIFLYYRPVQAYVQARSEVEQREVEVSLLRAEHAALERQLRIAGSQAAREREARRMGFVKPGEKLYIVKGIDSWRAAHAPTRKK